MSPGKLPNQSCYKQRRNWVEKLDVVCPTKHASHFVSFALFYDITIHGVILIIYSHSSIPFRIDSLALGLPSTISSLNPIWRLRVNFTSTQKETTKVRASTRCKSHGMYCWDTIYYNIVTTQNEYHLFKCPSHMSNLWLRCRNAF